MVSFIIIDFSQNISFTLITCVCKALQQNKNMQPDYFAQIDNHLKEKNQQNLLQDHHQNLIYDEEFKTTSQYLQILKKSSLKIQQLILQNDNLKHQNSIHVRNIEIHLKKQIELKLCISNLEEEIEILNQQLRNLQMKIPKQFDTFHGISPKQYSKLVDKLQNAISQNQLLRHQNKTFYDKQYTKQKNYRYVQQKFKETIRSQQQQIQSLKNQIQYLTEKSTLVQKIQAQNNLLKSQNKRLNHAMSTKLDQYEKKMNNLVKQLETQRYGKQMITEKYQQLTQVIQTIDKIRHEFYSKKKGLQFARQQNELEHGIEFNERYCQIEGQKRPIQKTLNKNKPRSNLMSYV